MNLEWFQTPRIVFREEERKNSANFPDRPNEVPRKTTCTKRRRCATQLLLVFFIAATVFGSLEVAETVAANAQRRFRGPGKLAAGRADVCPPMALNASQSATPSAPTADVQSAAGCDDQQ